MARNYYLKRGEHCSICNGKDNCSKIFDKTQTRIIGMTCARVSSNKIARDGRYIHYFDNETSNSLPQVTKSNPDKVSSLSAKEISEVYSALLAELDLNSKEYKYLKGDKRKLTDAQIKAMGLRSAPANEAIFELVNKLAEQFGVKKLSEVAGFYVTDKDRLWINLHEGNVIIPVRNSNGYITGLRNNYYIDDKYPKYFWVSVPNNKDGTPKDGVGAIMDHAYYSASDKTILGITEGEYKAKVASDKLGYGFLSVPGVGNWKSSKVTEAVQFLNPALVRIYYDTDYKDNLAVMNARNAMALELTTLGYKVEFADWNDAYKGIDDLLLNYVAVDMLDEPITYTPYKLICSGLPVDSFINEKFLSVDLLGIKKVTAIRSAKGTGKTYMANKYIQGQPSASVLAISPRRSLTDDIANRMNLVNYLDLYENGKLNIEKYNKETRLVTCLDSIVNFTSIKSYDILFLDEFEQMLRALAKSGTLSDGSRFQVHINLEEIIKRAKKIIVTDADLTATTHEYLKDIVGAENIEVIINEYRNPDMPTMEVLNSIDEAYHVVIKELEDGKNVFVPTTSIEESKRIAAHFNNYPCLLINSDNSSSEEIRQTMKNLNENIKNYRLLVGSPSIFTGVDISAEHFDTTVLIAIKSEQTHKDLLQAVARNRKAKKVYAYLEYQGKRNEPTSKDYWLQFPIIKNDMTERLINWTWNDEGEKVISSNSKSLLNLWANVNAAEKQSTNNLLTNFFEAAKAEGYELTASEALKMATFNKTAKKTTVMGLDNLLSDNKGIEIDEQELKEVHQERKEVRAEIKRQNIDRLLLARRITPAEYEALNTKGHLSKAEKDKVYKYIIETNYDVKLTKELIELEGANFKFSKALKNYMMLNGLLDTVTMDTESREANERFMTEQTHYTTKIQLAKLALQYIDIRKEFTKNTLDPEFITFVQQNNDNFYKFWNIKIKSNFKDSPIEFISSLLAKFGLKLKSQQIGTRIKREYSYSLDLASEKLMNEWSEIRMNVIKGKMEDKLLIVA